MAIDLGSPRIELHPLHGMHQLTTATPARKPGSVRRTASIDMTREQDSLDPVLLTGRARDVYTAADDTVEELCVAEMRATVEMLARVIRHIDITPAVPNLSRLVEGPAMSGFRGAVDAVAPQLRERRDLRYTLLDGVPVAALISGHALSASGQLGRNTKSGYLPLANQCAGFITGGLLMTSFEAGDTAVVTGPVAPDLDGCDRDGWHEMPSLPLYGMRRRRRIDVFTADTPPVIEVDAMFRDTFVRADSVETIIHDYTLRATVQSGTGTVLSCEASPRVLPWQECPGAVDSARRITGLTLAQLHSWVRNELDGPSTCTHLNDLLRSLADAAALIRELERRL